MVVLPIPYLLIFSQPKTVTFPFLFIFKPQNHVGEFVYFFASEWWITTTTTLPISQSALHVTCSRSSPDQHFCACTMWRTIVRTRSCTRCKNIAGFLVKSVQFLLASSHFPRAGSRSNSGVPHGTPGSGRASDRRRKMREHAVESARTLAGTFFSRFLSWTTCRTTFTHATNYW